MLKVCSKCKQELDISCFNKRRNAKDGLSYTCRQCQSIIHKEWHKKNIKHVKQYCKQWRKKHPEVKEKDKKCQKLYRLLLATYNGFSNQLKSYEEIRRSINYPKLLEIKCAYCGRWFSPTNNSVQNYLSAIKGQVRGELRLYCSENCKITCPTYGQEKYPKGFKHVTSREVVPLLRQIVLERDEYSCQICGLTIDEIEIHVHHILSYTLNKMLANDPDYCVSLCKNCHKWIHQQDGCRYHELRCSKK